MSASTTLLPFQPATLSTAQLAAVSFLARCSGRTHVLYTYQLRRWFGWCQTNGLDPLVGVQRAHVELYIRDLGDSSLMDSSVVTMMHGVRGFFRFAHIDGLITADPAVYARLPKVHRDESRTQGLDRLELIRFLQIAQTITVHHGALAYLLGINALRASEAAAVRIEDYADSVRGWARRCQFPAFIALAAKITRHRVRILAANQHNPSNALVESTNPKIRLITRNAYGFQSPDALIALAMLTLGPTRLALPGRK